MSRFLNNYMSRSNKHYASTASSFSCMNNQSLIIASNDTVISVSFLLRVLVLALIIIIISQVIIV